jgi:DNA-binding transcriptional LysR family regulator
MANLDPHLLRAFLSVADVGTVNGAAAALHRTQAAVSMQIRRLEEMVGAPLFERSPKGLALTAEGLMLVPYAREIITLNDEVRQRICGQRMEGRVKLGVVEDFAATRLVDILKAFRDLNPRVQIDLIVKGNRELATSFEADKLDLVICDTSEVSRKPLVVWSEQLQWTVRSDMAVPANGALPVIVFAQTCPWRTRAIEALSTRNLRWEVVCEASTLVAMATAVQVGVGIGPMMAATIPPGCRALEHSDELPAPVQVDIGLYVRTSAPEQARHLADFVHRSPGRPFAERARSVIA